MFGRAKGRPVYGNARLNARWARLTRWQRAMAASCRKDAWRMTLRAFEAYERALNDYHNMRTTVLPRYEEFIGGNHVDFDRRAVD